jgi:hypothetical protein
MAEPVEAVAESRFDDRHGAAYLCPCSQGAPDLPSKQVFMIDLVDRGLIG